MTTLTLATRMSRMPPSAVREILKVAERPDILSFAGGLPAPELFPVQALAEAHAKVFATNPTAALQYSATEGYVPLREWIASRLRGFGMRADVETTLITNGSQQGIDLAARVLLNPGDRIAVEDPSYLAALQAFSAYEADIVTVPSDDDGICVDDLERVAAKGGLRAVYLVPNFQNPKGTTLSLERRLALVKLAARYRFAIIEDDPYGELRYSGEALPPLAALDDEGVVIRLGSFSKTLAPGLRLGFATGPADVIRAMTIAKQATDLQTGTLSQRAAATLLDTFDFEAHLATLRTTYGERCKTMLDALAQHMPAGTTWTKPSGGMFVWLALPKSLRAEDLFAPALEQKVAFVPGSGFFAREKRYEFMRLNFSNRPPAQIAEGMARLGDVVRDALTEVAVAPPKVAELRA